MPTLNIFTGRQYLNDVTFPQSDSPTFATQVQDAMTQGSVTYRHQLFNEMTRQKTEEEQQALQKFYADSWRAEQAEDMTAFGRMWTGWQADSVQADIAETADNLRKARLIKDEEQETELRDKLAKLQFKLSQMPKPSETGWDSAYNFGQVLHSSKDALALEAAWWAGETAAAAGIGAVAGGPFGGVVGAAAVGLARGAQRLARAGRIASTAAKTYSLWEMMRRRESGSLYSELLDRDDLSEDQKQAMALAYGRSAATVELAGWTLGAGGLLVKGGKAAGRAAIGKIPAVQRWSQNQALKQGLKETAGAVPKTALQKLTTAGKIAGRVTGGAVAESAEEGTQQLMEITTIEQGLAGGTPTVGSVVSGAFQKMAGVGAEVLEGKLSPESITVIDSMASALLPSLFLGGVGASLNAAFSGDDVVPVNTGAPSEYEMKNSGLPQVLANAEKNFKRANALLNFLTETKDAEYIKKMVSNSEIEGHVFAAPEDVEMIMALGEMSPTAQRLIESSGIASAIRAGRKTGMAEIPMQAFAEFVANEEIQESGVLPELSKRITFNSSEQSYSSVDKKLKAGFNKDTAKKVKDKASEKLNQIFSGLRRQMELAKYTPEEIEANIDIYAAALGTLEDASNGAVTAEELARDFVFNIERRDYDVNVGAGLRGKKKLQKEQAEAIEKTISKIIGDKRPKLGHFTRYVEKGRKDRKGVTAETLDSSTVTAYSGSPIDYLLPSLKAIGTGEGHFAHGWGLYYALEFGVADRYRSRYKKAKYGLKWNDFDLSSYSSYEQDASEALHFIYMGLKYASNGLSEWHSIYDKLMSVMDSAYKKAHKLHLDTSAYVIAKKHRDLVLKTGGEEFAKSKEMAKTIVKFASMSDEEAVAILEKDREDVQKTKKALSDTVSKLNSPAKNKLKQEIIDGAVEGLRNTKEAYYVSRLGDATEELSRHNRNLSEYKKQLNSWKNDFDRHVEERVKTIGDMGKPELARQAAETWFKEHIRDWEGAVANLERETPYYEKRVASARKTVESVREAIKILQSKDAVKNLTIFADVNVGQVKQFSVRKIDTFMREDKPMYMQNGFIKKAVAEMLSKESSLDKVAMRLAAESINGNTLFDAWYDRFALEVERGFEKEYNAFVSGRGMPFWDVKEYAYRIFIGTVNIKDLEATDSSQRVALLREIAEAKGKGNISDAKKKLKEFDRDVWLRKKVFNYAEKARNSYVSKMPETQPVDSTVTADAMYDYMVNVFLGKDPDDYGGRYEKKDVHEAKKKASLMLAKYGINGISYFGHLDKECLVVFNPSIIRVKQSFYSEKDGAPENTDWFDIFDETVGMRGAKEIFVAQHADTTTFAHEVMHFVVTSLVEMYNDGSISEVWRKEVDKLYDYFSEVPVPGSHKMSMTRNRKGKITLEKEAHETLSAGFQRYIEEGHAHTPSLEKLYAYIKDLSAKLWSALSRGYFRDRELSDEQIRFYDKVMQGHMDIVNTEYKYGYAPLEKMANVTDDDYELYKLERTIARAKSSNNMFKAQRQLVQNREHARWKEIYDEAFKNAYEALKDEHEYILIDFITKNGGINKDSMVASTKLTNKVPEKYFSTDSNTGLTVEELVGKFGPDMNIVDIVKILATTPDIEVAARREARNEADTKYLQETDPVADITPANAMRNILFIRSLVKESMMLKGDGLSKFTGHYSEWIKAAEEYFMGITLKNATNYPKWADMESRITDDYVTALNGGDTQTASLKADQRAMVNYVLVRSKQLMSQHAKFKRRFEKFYRMPTSSDLKTIDGITWNLIHTILKEYGYTTRRGRINANAYNQMRDWIAERKGAKYFPAQDFEAELDILLQPPKLTSLTVEGFNRMAALLEKIRAVGEAETKIFMAERQQRLDIVVGEIIENVEKMREAKGAKAFDPYRIGSLDSYITPQFGMLEPLFGDLGMRELWAQLRDALVARDTLGDTVRGMVADSFIKNNVTAILDDKRKFDVGGWEVDNSVLLFALQHSGNQHNKQNAIATLQQYYKNPSFSEVDYEEFLNASPMGLRNYVNDLWAMFGFLKQQIDTQTRAATGGIVGSVAAEPYTLRDGTQMTGGYFPAPKMSLKNSTIDSVENMYDNNLFFPMTGFTKDRVNNKLGDLDMGQEQLARHIYKAVNFATTQVAFNDIQTVLNTKELKDFLGGDYPAISGYISDWVRTAIMPVTPAPKFIKALQKMPTIVFLGFKGVSGLVQLLGIIPAYSQISTAELTKSAAKLLNVGKYFKINEEMRKRSPFMADRSKKFDSRFYGLFNDKTFFERQTRKWGEGVTQAALTFVRTFQSMADLIVWDAANAEALNKGLSADEARRHADNMVQKTQGDRSRMNTPKGFESVAAKFFQVFMSYILTLRGMYKGAVLGRKYKQLGAMIALVALSAYFEAYFKEKDKDWRRKLLGKKTKGTDYDLWKRVQNRWIAQTVGTFGGVALPFAGLGEAGAFELTSEAIKQISDGYRPYTQGASPAVELWGKAAKAVTLDEDTLKDIYDWDMSLGANLIDFVL